MDQKQVPIQSIVVKDEIQQRVNLNQEYISEYSVEIANGAQFPPLVVYSDGEQLFLADGRHRYEAYKLAGVETVDVIIHEGGLRAAILHAVGANAEHGLRRSNADKRKAVTTLLTDSEWGKLTDSEIAKICRVTQPFVSNVRRELTQNGFEWGPTRICADGREMDTSRIGAKSTAEESKNSQAAEESVSPQPDLETTDNNEEDQVPEEDDAGNPPDTDSDTGVEMTTPDNEEVSQADDEIGESNSNDSKDLLIGSESDQSISQESSEKADSADFEEDEPFSVESAEVEEDVSVGSDPEVDENHDEPADIDDVEILKGKITYLRNTIKEQDHQLKLKDNLIDELEKDNTSLKEKLAEYDKKKAVDQTPDQLSLSKML